MPYIWQDDQWPDLRWDDRALANLLARTSREEGRLLGKMEGLGFDLRREAHLRTLTEDVVKTSEIEGEMLPREQVRSSIARRLGLDVAGLVPADRNVEGIVEMMLDATSRYAEPLTTKRLFDWHAALFPTGRSGMRTMTVGAWRKDASGPMQVVSGPMAREKIHYEAPPATRIADEMKKFLRWFAKPGDTDPLLIAGLAHFWFVTIHPFDDGNGRIARAIADTALARTERTEQRFYSMSSQIRHERSDYYNTLEWTQKGGTDITRWQTWFLECLLRAIEGAHGALSGVLTKAQFWERFAKEPFNERQIAVLNLLLDGLEGKLTSSKWAKLTKSSQDTAHRDIMALVRCGAVKKDAGGGRSTSYSIAAP
jgi:Fic family protein